MFHYLFKILSTSLVDFLILLFFFMFLKDTRQQFTKLLGVHSLLKRLQFLFKLPAKLSARIKEEQYAQVRSVTSFPKLNVTFYSYLMILLFNLYYNRLFKIIFMLKEF